MKLTNRLILSNLLVFLLSGFIPSVSLAKDRNWDIKKQSIEENAPDFVLDDLNGKKIKLSDYKGRVILLVFGTTWCPYCRTEIPNMKKIYSKYKEKGLEIFYIDIQESYKKVSSFAAKYKLPYKVLLDKDGKVAYLYGVRGVPTTVLINREGKILCRMCRSVDHILDMLFNAKTK